MSESEPLQQIGRTSVHYRGRTLTYFGGCDYFRLASHPAVLKAVSTGLQRYGLNVAASRLTSGNHELYEKLEKQLATFFRAEAALLFNTGYTTNLAVAQALAGQFSHALVDERAHVSVTDAAQWLNCPILKFKHRDADDLKRALHRCGRASRPIVLTDGMFSHDGSVPPLRAYAKLLPRDGLLLVDDAHGAGTLGRNGGGAVELEGLSRTRLVQCVTLSKAFGVYGGAVIGSQKLRDQVAARSRLFIGSTPLPLPLANAAIVAVRFIKSHPALRTRLNRNVSYLRDQLRRAGLLLPATPGPILQIHIARPQTSDRLRRALLQAGILPPFIKYPGGPVTGYFRFAISSEHTQAQLDNLLRVLLPFAK